MSDRRTEVQAAVAFVIFADRKLVGIPTIRDDLVAQVTSQVMKARPFVTPPCMSKVLDSTNRAVVRDVASQAHRAGWAVAHRSMLFPERVCETSTAVQFALTFA